MTLHSGSGYIVEFVARLINDEALAYHDTYEIESALTPHAIEARYLDLLSYPTYASGGAASYLVYYVPDYRYWETTVTFVDGTYASVTPDTLDHITGRFAFNAEPSSRPIRINGWTHDPYGAAADLLEVRGAMLSEDYDSFSVFNGSFANASKRAGPLQLARQYRMKSRGYNGTHQLTRSDLSGIWQL